jgi:hypothetical protein
MSFWQGRAMQVMLGLDMSWLHLQQEVVVVERLAHHLMNFGQSYQQNNSIPSDILDSMNDGESSPRFIW